MIIESEDTVKIRRDLEIRRHRLIEKCRMAMHLCLSRYSTHYKALYRLAHLYYTYRPMRDYGKCRDLLLGLPGMAHWAHKPHMPAPGLFQERSKTNFFNGIWKMNVDEVERPGSFQNHMHRSLVLLINVFIKQADCSMLLFVAQQLHRVPEKDKKFLKVS